MQLQRRSVLTGLAAASLCPICLASGASAEEGHAHAPHWSYEGEGGPEHWGDLQPDFKSCKIGLQQSPIDLAKPISAKLSALNIQWKGFPLVIKNNGHTIQINVPPGCTVSDGDGETYTMVNFHFHHPSEHTVDGKSYQMEAHFVHLNEKKDAAIAVGVFIVPGAENAVLSTIWPHMPKTEAEKTIDGVTVDPRGLLPAKLDRYRYEGSLTTPACGEFVHWNVFRESVTASEAQIKAFADLFPNNARPIMPRNRRFLLESF